MSPARPALHRVLLLSVILLTVGFACWHAWSVTRYLERVRTERFQLPPAASASWPITLGVAADGRTWLRLTEERLERGSWRFDRTWTDGLPEGREVLWHSSWSWWLEALGRLRAAWTDEPLALAMASASAWAQLPLWLLAAGLGGSFVGRRYGFVAAAAFLAMLVGHRGLYVAFFPAYPDHHGLAAAAGLGVVLGLCAGGFGSEGRARSGVVVSALCGAVGLAVSTASTAPLLAVAGAVGFLSRGLALREAGIGQLKNGAEMWRLWGRVGAGAAILLYLLEFAPDRLGWRLEVNHPVHALAWWGGAELVAWWWSRATGERFRHGRWLLALAAAAVAAPVVVLASLGVSAFSPAGLFLRGIHDHIGEFSPLWKLSGSPFWLLLLSAVPLGLLPAAAARLEGASRVTLLGVAGMAFPLLLLSIWQHRWWSVAATAQIPLVALVAAAFLRRSGGLSRYAVGGLLLAVALPGPVLLALEQIKVARVRDIQEAEAMQLLFRDIAWSLRHSSPGRRLVLVAPPNASVGVGFYGDLRAVGTLYWENDDGLLSVARVLTATDDVEAARELERAGATHLLLVDPGDFTSEYLDAVRREGGRDVPVERTLGRRLLDGRDVPGWARALPYVVPPQFDRLRVRVALYSFEPDLSFAESRRALGVAKLVAGDEGGGRGALREAAQSGSAEAALLLAWRLATWGTPRPGEAAEAVALAERAVASLPEAPSHRRVLAAAYAAAKRWPEAQATVLRALDLAQESGDAATVAELERDFVRYRDFLPPAAPVARP